MLGLIPLSKNARKIYCIVSFILAMSHHSLPLEFNSIKLQGCGPAIVIRHVSRLVPWGAIVWKPLRSLGSGRTGLLHFVTCCHLLALWLIILKVYFPLMRKPNGSGVEWVECSLIIGTGCWVQVFSLILDSSVGLSPDECLLEIRFQRPWFKSRIQQRKTACFLSTWKSLACARASKLTTIDMYHIKRLHDRS